MKSTNEKLAQWAIDKIKREYPDDVALLLDYEFEKTEDNIPQDPYMYFKGGFDYFVPATERGNELAQTFIIDGVGYDLYPRSWERLEEMANLGDYNTPCLGNCHILYARSEEDRARFEALRQKLFANLQDAHFMRIKALEKYKSALEIHQSLLFCDNLSDARMYAGYVADFLATAVAHANGKYFLHSQINQMEEMLAFEDTPEMFAEYYRALPRAHSIEELRQLCHLLIASTRNFLEKHTPAEKNEQNPDYAQLAGWYEELSYTWRRIYHRCALQDAEKVFLWGCMLQNELNIIAEEYGMKKMPLLEAFDPDDLSKIKARAEELEEYVVDFITRHGQTIDAYADIEEFLMKNGW